MQNLFKFEFQLKCRNGQGKQAELPGVSFLIDTFGRSFIQQFLSDVVICRYVLKVKTISMVFQGRKKNIIYLFNKKRDWSI